MQPTPKAFASRLDGSPQDESLRLAGRRAASLHFMNKRPLQSTLASASVADLVFVRF